jgi:dienelactone hydrolase
VSSEAIRPEIVRRADVTFLSSGRSCAAWLYEPQAASRSTRGRPLVVLGHGLGATRELGLDAYARRFAAAGFGALAFDYRHFGASHGEPRQLLAVRRQLADWAAAVSFARALPGVDPDRIAIWGSSFAGGHVIRVAARDQRVAAVVSQCPFTSGPASVRALGLKSVLKVAPLALADQAAELVGAKRTRVALVGPPGSAGLMTAPDAETGYRALIPPDVVLEDRVAARIGLWIGFYSPGRAARRVSCPILFCICDRDSVAPAKPTARYAARAPRGEVRHYPVGHFDIYLGEPFERVVGDQIDFLRRHLSS